MEVKKPYLKSFYWKDYIMIISGLILYAFGLTGFLLPNKIVTGGLTGITVLIRYSTEIPIWVSYISINAVLLIIAWKIVGKSFVIKTVLSVIALTFLLRFGELYITKPIIQADSLLSSMIGAMFCGAGLGLVYSVNGSTGGTDIVTKYRHVSMGRVLLLVDVLIVGSSFFLFRSVEKIAIGFIVMAVMFYAVDVVISGMRQSVQFFIFTSKHEEVANHINTEIKRGCTIIDGMGWYSKKTQKIIVVLARKNESTSIFRLVKSIDQNAFVTQANVVGVYGKGFDSLK